VAEPDQMVGSERDAVAVVAAIHGQVDALHGPGNQNGRHAIGLGELDVLNRSADRRRHDDPIATELQQCFDEGPLLLDGIVMIGQDEGLAAAVELAFDRLQDFPVEGVHDVVYNDADNAGAGGPEARRAPIVDIAQRARLLLDLLPGISCNQRTVAQGERNGCGGQAEAFGNRRQLDLLRHVPSGQASTGCGRI